MIVVIVEPLVGVPACASLGVTASGMASRFRGTLAGSVPMTWCMVVFPLTVSANADVMGGNSRWFPITLYNTIVIDLWQLVIHKPSP